MAAVVPCEAGLTDCACCDDTPDEDGPGLAFFPEVVIAGGFSLTERAKAIWSSSSSFCRSTSVI